MLNVAQTSHSITSQIEVTKKAERNMQLLNRKKAGGVLVTRWGTKELTM